MSKAKWMVVGLAALHSACALEGTDDRADESSARLAISTASADLPIRFAGDAQGVVLVTRPSETTPVATCTETCSVALTPGEPIELIAVTPLTFGGWGDLCAGTDPVCSFTMADGLAADPAFDRGPAEEWTVLLPDRAVSADFDPDGDLVVGTLGGLYKLSAAGEPIWSQAAVTGPARVDPDGDIFALMGEDLVKVCGVDGSVLWSSHLGPNSCVGWTRMGHVFETTPGGDVAIQHGGTLRVFDGTGLERWSAAVPSVTCVVAVNPQGVVHSTSEDPVSFEPTILIRFAADGTRLTDTEDVTHQYHAAVAFDPAGTLFASSSGHGDVHLRQWSPALEPGYQKSLETFDPDYTENGVAADATGHAIWAFAPNESNNDMEGVVAHWIDPDGVVDFSATKASFRSNFWTFGVQAHDVAADDGNFVLAGKFGSAFDDPLGARGWVQAYRP